MSKIRNYKVGDEPVPGYWLTAFLGSGGFGGLGVRQIDLQTWLALAEIRRDDEKNQQDRENIDQRNDVDRGRAALACVELHTGQRSAGG